jgi:hypothetical protein
VDKTSLVASVVFILPLFVYARGEKGEVEGVWRFEHETRKIINTTASAHFFIFPLHPDNLFIFYLIINKRRVKSIKSFSPQRRGPHPHAGRI